MNIPLSQKLCPKSIKDIIGQEELVGKGKVLYNLVKNKKLFSMILYGNPGIGKTSIAISIVNDLDIRYRMLNATINNKHDFDVVELAKAAGATFVARGTTFHAQMLTDLIVKGIQHKGFSLIEAVSACPTSFGRQNKMGGPVEMILWQRDHGVMKAAWDKMTDEQRQGKFPIGVLHETNDRVEYTVAYDHLIKKAQEGKK